MTLSVTYDFVNDYMLNNLDWNSGVSVRPPYVHPYIHPYIHKVFSDFHLIWCVGRPRPDMRTSLTSTRSKVKGRVTELPKLRKVHFSRSISSAGFLWTLNWLLVVIIWDLDFVRARFLNFLLGKLSREFRFHGCQYFTKFKLPYFGSARCYSRMLAHAGSPTSTVYVDVTLARSKVKVKVMEPLNFRQLPITAHF